MNVLDRNLDVDRNFLIEASAGTGKTFSIENIVVRLLLKENTLSQILVVTFTRSAARDLKKRIRRNIENSIEILKNPENCSIDYLQEIIEKNNERSAIKKLELALLQYDQAPIFTIHGFCSRVLHDFVFEGDLSLGKSAEESPLPKSYVIKIIRDFFRTEIHSSHYSAAQLDVVIKDHKNSLEKMELSLLDIITKGLPIVHSPHYDELYISFCNSIEVIKNQYHVRGSRLVEDCQKAAPFYKEITTKSKTIKPEILEKFTRFAQIFDKEKLTPKDFDEVIKDQLSLLDLFSPENKTVKGKQTELILHYPHIQEILRQHLLPLVCPKIIFARMASDCKKLLKRHLMEEEILGFDEILESTERALINNHFVESVRGRFNAAIIDEFQDTDPLQWKIFKKLFLAQGKKIYLVGDPKQSIYSFRQADIYTYLQAGNELGKASHHTLKTNYRSQPSLIKGLNILFSEKNAPGLITLPRTGQNIEYQEVEAPLLAKEYPFSSLHFCIAENNESAFLKLEEMEKKYFLPFIVQEIQKLREDFKYSSFAILVSDRYQAKRVATFLKEWKISSTTQRSESLTQTDALPALRDLLKGILFVRHESSFKTALGGPIIGWNHEKIKKLTDDDRHQLMSEFYYHRTNLINFGFAYFFESLLKSYLGCPENTILERLLRRESGDIFYQDLRQIVSLILEYQCKTYLATDSLVKFLDDFENIIGADSEEAKKFSDPTQNAVQILTLHSSKGLEFDIVFPLGLLAHTRQPDQLIPYEDKIIPVSDKNSEIYKNYCLEVDAEKIRQLYVAMTRAKVRLYTPVILLPKRLNVKPGSVSPMELYLARLRFPKTDPSTLYSRISGYDGQVLLNFLNEVSADISYTLLNQCDFVLKNSIEDETPLIHAPKTVKIPNKPLSILSFTHISQNFETKVSAQKAPFDFQNKVKSPHTLPSGSDTGNLLHLILEKIPFDFFKNNQSIDEFLKPFIDATPYESWGLVIGEMIKNALQMPIHHTFSLQDINPDKVFRETEFLYPYEGNLLKGVIDLMFEFNGKYYILDWKSNWLDNYTVESMTKAMEENHYYLQAELYTDALKKYLKLFDIEFENVFGGVFYLFLRGGVIHFYERKS